MARETEATYADSNRWQSHGNGFGLGSEEVEHPCMGCWHWRGDFHKCCNYIFDMGRKRPCEPGAECTERLEIVETEPFSPWR